MTARRVALGLWIAWAIIAWNVVFDHVIVTAGRDYLAAAVSAADAGAPYAEMDRWMAPARVRGAWMATTASGSILVVGLLAIRAASRRP
jgi:hypothetical protein